MGRPTGSAVHNWRGGRSVASHGYVLVRVGKEHHLADVRGYAYEHRVIAEQKIGRRLRRREEVHHINGNRGDNRPENLEVVESLEHGVKHRTVERGKQQPYEINALVVCACGCGEMFPKFDAVGRPRRFVSGHNPPDAPTATAVLKAIGVGRRSRAEIIEAVGTSTHAVATCLSKLKRAGRVRRVGHAGAGDATVTSAAQRNGIPPASRTGPRRGLAAHS